MALAVLAPSARAAPDWSLAGEHRARYESLDPQFRPLLDADDELLAFRTSLTITADWPRWRFTGELMDARATRNDEGSFINTTIVNTLEPLQLNAERRWDVPGDGGDASLRFGRMTADLGSRRLLARNGFRNTRNSFVGVDFTWHGAGGHTLRALSLEPMFALPRQRAELLDNEAELDNRNENTRLLGLLYGKDLGEGGDRLEIYWLGLDAEELIDQRKLDTLGAWILREAAAGRWHYEAELAVQSGRSSALAGGSLLRNLDHEASFAHLEFGYSFESELSFRVELEFDVASGDRNPDDPRNERFDTLFGARRFDYGPTGIYGPFARANLRSYGARWYLRPAARLDAVFVYRDFRLESASDAWTTTLLRDPSGQSGDSLGRQFEFSLAWRPAIERLRFELGGARLSKGSFVGQTAPELSATSHYYYVSTTVLFLGATGR